MTPPAPREAAVLAHRADGLTQQEIAYALGLSHHTIKYYLDGLRRRTGATTLAALTARAIAAGWVTVTLDEIGEAA